MADKVFRGLAAAVADVWTYQVTAYSDTTVHGITRNGKTVGFTISGSGYTAASAAAALQLLLAASTYPEFLEYSWTVSGDTVTWVATTAGIPATFTKASGVTTQATLLNAVTATGPNDFGNAANWGGSLPSGTDRMVLDEYSPDALYGLGWVYAAGSPPAALILDNYGGSVGLPLRVGGANTFDPNAANGYLQDRPRFLLLPNATFLANVGSGDNLPARVQLQLAGSATTVNVYGLGPVPAGESATMYLQGTTGHPRLAVSQGTVGVALDPGTTGGFTTVLVGDEGNPQSDAKVIFGDGATVPDVQNQSGSTAASVTVTSLVMGLSAAEHRQTAGNCTAVQDGGTLDFRSSGTLTVTARGPGTNVTFAKSPVPKTLNTASSFSGGAYLVDPASTRTTGSGATFDAVSLPLCKLGPGVAIVK